MKRRTLIGAVAAASAAGPAAVAQSAPHEIPTAELALEINALLGPVMQLGPTSNGQRRIIPITGGWFKGPRIEGEVLTGADWQTTRADGCTILEAIYAIKARDGTVIPVRNLGLAAPRADGKTYIRTTPSFDAPRGPHDWLNQSVFVGTLEVPDPGKAVRIRAFRIG